MRQGNGFKYPTKYYFVEKYQRFYSFIGFVSRPGSQSPPLPPPPPPEESEHAEFGRPRQTQSLVQAIVPDDQNLPGWVPKNYIEKGMQIQI
jgi:hypothetical protein